MIRSLALFGIAPVAAFVVASASVAQTPATTDPVGHGDAILLVRNAEGDDMPLDEVDIIVWPVGGEPVRRRLRRSELGYVISGLGQQEYEISGRHGKKWIVVGPEGAKNLWLTHVARPEGTPSGGILRIQVGRYGPDQ